MSLDFSKHVGGGVPTVLDYATSRSDYFRQGEILSGMYDLQTPGSPQPRGYSSPRIRRIDPSSRLLSSTGQFVMPSPPPRPATSGAQPSPKSLKLALPDSPTPATVKWTPNRYFAESPASRAGTEARPSTSGLSDTMMSKASTQPGSTHGEQSARGTRSEGGGAARNSRQAGHACGALTVKFACTEARVRGSRVWGEFSDDRFLNSYRDKLFKRAARRKSEMTRAQAIASGLHSGACLPVAWSPTPEPDSLEEPREAFMRAAKETGVKYQPPVWKAGISKGKAVASLNRYQVQMQYAGRSEFCGPREVWEPLGKKRRKPSKAEKLLGLHVKVTKEARAEQMQVVYSTQYYETKNQEIPDDAFPENPNPKYIGTVVECDPDGLMTNVKWQDGSVEYCCTGYSKKYFLALVDDEAEGSDKMKSSEKMDWAEFAARCPKWTGTPHGMYAVPFKTSHRLIKDMTTVAMEVKRLHTRMSRAMPGSVAQQQIHEEFLIAKQELQEMNSEREQMASWMEFTIGDEKFRIPPSSLAPPASASLGTKQPCILSQILKEVRRDAEKERRRRRREEEAEVERKRLERKSIRSTIYADELKQHNKRQEAYKMDPWEAVSTASPDVLIEILREAFTLFDIDGSGSMDAIEFEQALSSLGIEVPQNLIQFVIADADKDNNGTLDWHEFKDLATTMVEVSKAQKTSRKKKEVEQARKAAAGKSKVIVAVGLHGIEPNPESAEAAPSEQQEGVLKSPHKPPDSSGSVWGNLADNIFSSSTIFTPSSTIKGVSRTASMANQRAASSTTPIVQGESRTASQESKDPPAFSRALSGRSLLLEVLESNDRNKHHTASQLRIEKTVERLSHGTSAEEKYRVGGSISRTGSTEDNFARTDSGNIVWARAEGKKSDLHRASVASSASSHGK